MPQHSIRCSIEVNLCCLFWFGFVQRVLGCPQCSSGSKGNESWRKYSIWTYIFISVWVLVLGLFRRRNLTVGAVVLTVVKRSAMVRYNHQLLDVTLETKKSTVRTSENSTNKYGGLTYLCTWYRPCKRQIRPAERAKFLLPIRQGVDAIFPLMQMKMRLWGKEVQSIQCTFNKQLYLIQHTRLTFTK